jgi:hypothetical protein
VSISNPSAAPPSIFPAVEHAVDRALRQVGPYLEGLLQRAAPTPAMLRALGDELEKAQRDPRSVAHPELVDPAVFWARSAWPQAAAVVKNARGALLAIAEELSAVVRGSEQVLETWLKAQLDANLADAALDPRSSRDTARRQRAEREAQAQRDAEEAGLDPAQRAAFERAWTEGYAQDVAVRAQELRTVVPFRHQDLWLTAHQQASDAIAHDVEEMVQDLTEPILGIGERMVRRYDELSSGFAPSTADTGFGF